MHCSFTLTSADFIALHAIIQRRLTQLSSANSKLFFSNLVVWVPLGIAFAAYAALFQKYPGLSRELAVVAVAFVVGVALMIAGSIFKQRIYRKVMLAPDSWFLSEQSVEMSPADFVARGTYGEVRYPWASFRHLAEDERNLYLFIDNSQAFVLPKAALASVDQVAQVKAWLPL